MKKSYSRRDLVDYMEARVVTITYAPEQGPRRTGKFTLQLEYIKELDNWPEGFETIREAAYFDPHCVIALDISTNRWESIRVGNILRVEV